MFRMKQNWVMAALLAIPAMAQQYPPQQQPEGQYAPPYNSQQAVVNFASDQLDQMVARIALYPDPLLAQIFAAATFPEQIQDAAQWADQHHYLNQQDLARAIQNDQTGFDPSIQALLPFPSVLQMMANDMNWTSSLGNAFMSQGAMLQDSVQRMRRQAYDNGYLRNSDQITLSSSGPSIEIQPVDPGYVVVPYYDPAVVYYRPWRPGLRTGITFGYGVRIGTFFDSWGWQGSRFAWDRHEVYVNNRVWDRRVYDERHVTSYRPAGFFNDRDRFERRPVTPGPVYRPVERRPEFNRPSVNPVPAPRAEEHLLQGRNNNERRAMESGRPAPREIHGREERRRN